jgi:hypothetical protein
VDVDGAGLWHCGVRREWRFRFPDQAFVRQGGCRRR